MRFSHIENDEIPDRPRWSGTLIGLAVLLSSVRWRTHLWGSDRGRRRWGRVRVPPGFGRSPLFGGIGFIFARLIAWHCRSPRGPPWYVNNGVELTRQSMGSLSALRSCKRMTSCSRA